MAKEKITAADVRALNEAAGLYFRRDGDTPDVPKPGVSPRPTVTKAAIGRAKTALDRLVAGRGSDGIGVTELADLANILDRLSTSPEQHRPGVAEAIRKASDALKALTAPTKTSARVTTASIPSFLQPPQLSGRNSPDLSPEELYSYQLRDAWRVILRSVIYKAPSSEPPGRPFGTQTPTAQRVQVQWLIFKDGDSYFWLNATYLNGNFERVVFTSNGGHRQPGEFTLFSNPSNPAPYAAAEQAVVDFFTDLYFERNPLPQPPTAPTGSQITLGVLSFIVGGETAGDRFDRETRDHNAALEKVRQAVRRAPLPSLTFYKGPAQTGSDPSPTAPTSAGTPPTPASPPPAGGAAAISYRSSARRIRSSLVDSGELVFEGPGDFRRDFSTNPNSFADHVGGAGENELPRIDLPPAVRRPPLFLP
ncbi:MAG: hypothetical protein Q7S98_00755 [Deltaproteobacteria bacterium]|nr:hypothetical protein [Deltaproteobacteria bacterium]